MTLHKGQTNIGSFKKGRIPWNKDKEWSLSSRDKMRVAKLKNPTRFWTGKERSLADREKMRQARLRNPNRYWLGKTRSPETNRKNREWHIHHPNFKFSNTRPELVVKELLERLNVKYIQQHPIGDIANVDFYLPEVNLVIECDGCYWHGCSDHFPQRSHLQLLDEAKTQSLEQKGYGVLRFWEHELVRMQVSTTK